MTNYPGASLFPGANVFPGSGTTGGPFLFLGKQFQRRMPIMAGLAALINFSASVLRIDGQWVDAEFPSEQQLAAADLYFPGGYQNIIYDVDVADALIAAGYDVTDLSLPAAP